MKIERELYIKSILFNLFGFTGDYPYSSTYKQLNTLCKIVYKKPIYKQTIDQDTMELFLLEAKKRDLGYAEYFLRKWKIQSYGVDLPDSIKRRISNLEPIKQRYIFDILANYDDITFDNIFFIFSSPYIDFYTASIVIDLYIESIYDIHNIIQILSEIDMRDKELILDYVCDYISDFSRREIVADWNLNTELNNKIISLETFDFFMVQFYIDKRGHEINKSDIDDNIKSIISDILLQNAERPFKRLKMH
jgi:hypothetical protein